MSWHNCTDGRVETFDQMLIGDCTCGEVIVKITNSSISPMESKDRYVYVDDQSSPFSIFRCRNCKKVIDETFNSWE